MKTLNTTKLLALAGLFAASATTAMATDNDDLLLRARLNGIQQVPSVLTKGSGLFSAVVYSDHVDYQISFKKLTSNLVEAHIHLAQAGANGKTMIEFCGGKVKCPASTSGTLKGTLKAADVIAIPEQNVDAFNFNKLVTALKNGVAYVNLHTANIDGEVRGQIVVDQ